MQKIGTFRTKFTNTALGQKCKMSFPTIKRKKKCQSTKASIVSLEAIGILVKRH